MECRVIEGLLFECTCEACPEQYDVFKDDKQVAYVRLRWNHLRVSYPDVGGRDIYSKDITDYAMQGMFKSDEQRDYYLNEIARIVNAERCAEVQGGH